MTHSLTSQQQGFFGHVVSPSIEATGALGLLKPTHVSPARQFEVYQRAYASRLVDCLRDDYPLVELALGKTCFDASCRSYAAEFPPTTNSLNFFGRSFASWLQGTLEVERSWIYDLARVEWAFIEAIHADARSVLGPETFGLLGPEQWPQLRLQTSKTLSVLELNYDIASYLSQSDAQNHTAAPKQSPSSLAICRRGNDLWRLPLEPWAATLLQQLGSGVALGEALERLADAPELAPSDEVVFNTFARWLEAGVFCNVAPY